MALHGTLEDLGVVEVIQLPQRGRRTGVLVLKGKAGEASLFYHKGELVHASLNNFKGTEVLVELFGWEGGEFEFRLGQETKERSVKIDLHRAVMQALKERDERKREEELRKKEGGQQPQSAESSTEKMSAVLKDFVNDTKFARYGCLLDPEGNLLFEVTATGKPPNRAEELRKSLYTLSRSYPSRSPFRVVIEEGDEIVVLFFVEKTAMILVAKSNVPMGAILIAVSKLERSLSSAT